MLPDDRHITRQEAFPLGYGSVMPEQSSRRVIADIARLAGVGVGTASRALNNAPNVAPATRQKVLDVAERMSYVVSPGASSLAKGTTGRVALVVPHLSRWFFGTVVEGLDSVLRAADLDVLLYHVGDLDDRRRFFERLPARRKVDAVVVVAFPSANWNANDWNSWECRSSPPAASRRTTPTSASTTKSPHAKPWTI